jgi:hypothetical protein
MLSSRNELILVGVLIFYIAFVPRLQIVRELLSTPIGKAAALAGIVYVYKYVSCSASLLLVVAYLRCGCNSREMMENPSSTVASLSAVMPGTPINTAPPTSGPGAPVNTMPPNTAISTAPMTTPMPTMPTIPNTMINPSGGFQPSMNSTSSVSAPV